MRIKQFIKIQNSKKKLFTPGPGSLIEENILGIEPCFGRNDQKYEKIEISVNQMKLLSGHLYLLDLTLVLKEFL